ncbi:MAG: hypothetical protein K0Q74_529 [Gammaproteobacteria bacterium]|nr:hypothetical protein [Gammaproteobacteria bacterium]
MQELNGEVIHLAAKEGRMDAVQALVTQDKSIINYVDDSGKTALFYAISSEHFEIADFLLINGADLNATQLLKLLKNTQNLNGIEYIAKKMAEIGRPSVKTEALYWIVLKVEAFAKIQDVRGQPPPALSYLQRAADYLLAADADIDRAWMFQPHSDAKTLLAHMVKRLSSLLLESLHNENEIQMAEDPERAMFFLESGIPGVMMDFSFFYQEKSRDEKSIQAVIAVVEFLLKNGANPEDTGLNEPDILKELGTTMLKLVFNYHVIKISKYFLQNKKLDRVSEKSSQALWEILSSALNQAKPFLGRNETLRATISLIKEASQISQSRYDYSELQVLCKVTEEMLGIQINYSEFLDMGLEMMPIRTSATTPNFISFVTAAYCGAKETVARFLALQGKRLSQNNKLYALYQAASQGHAEIVHLLLTQGGLSKEEINSIAQIQHDDGSALGKGQTALSIAAARQHFEVVVLLVKYGADVNFGEEDNLEVNDDNEPPGSINLNLLENATVNNHREMMAFLLGNGGKIGKALQIAIDNSRPNLARFLLKTAKQKGRIGEFSSALLDAAKSERLDIVMFLLDQDVPPTRGILNAIADNFDDQNLPNIFSRLKHPRHKEGALRAAIHSGRFLTAGYLLSEGVNIDYLGSGGKTLLENLAQEIEASLVKYMQTKEESLEASWKTKLQFLLEHGANPEILNCFPSVLALLGEKTLVKLNFNYLYRQAAVKLDQEEKHEEDNQASQAQELRSMLLSSLRNVEKPSLKFTLFKGEGPALEVVQAIRELCESQACRDDLQALQILKVLAEKAGIEVKPNISLQSVAAVSVVGAAGSLNAGPPSSNAWSISHGLLSTLLGNSKRSTQSSKQKQKEQPVMQPAESQVKLG